MPVARLLYTLLLVVALPAAVVFLLWRSRRHRGYRAHWGERFLGLAPLPAAMPAISPGAQEPPGTVATAADDRASEARVVLLWIHAVSVGETRAAQPLVEALLAERPGLSILLTHGTPTGRDTGRKLFGDRVTHAYLPYDLPWAVATFLDRQRPALGLLIETEVWPNLVAACRSRGIPLCLVNTRLSARSLLGYQRFASLSRPAFGGLNRVLAQTSADAERLAQLGAADIRLTGNLKSDADPDPHQVAAGRGWRGQWEAGAHSVGTHARPVWLAASTREGEDAAVIVAARALASSHPEVLLLWAPRHPHRVPAIEAALDRAGLSHERRSATTAPQPETVVWIGDTLGELAAYIAAADVVLMGGSLAALGGQNLLEPCAQGKPVIVGPHTFNFLEVTELAIAAGAAIRVDSGEGLAEVVGDLLTDTRRRAAMGEAARAFRESQRGSLQRTIEALRDLLPQA